jgi:Holliday junction resolvase RusA-like endonuclease
MPTPRGEAHYARPSWKSSIVDALPYSTKALLSAYRLARGGLPELYVEIPLSPPSVNSMYGKRTNQQKFYLDPRVAAFREMTDAACWRRTFKPRSAMAAVLAIESEGWLSLEHKIRDKDADNPIKVVLDALARSLGFNDKLIFEVYDAKIISRREATHVWLFDLGEVVPAVGGPKGAT